MESEQFSSWIEDTVESEYPVRVVTGAGSFLRMLQRSCIDMDCDAEDRQKRRGFSACPDFAARRARGGRCGDARVLPEGQTQPPEVVVAGPCLAADGCFSSRRRPGDAERRGPRSAVQARRRWKSGRRPAFLSHPLACGFAPCLAVASAPNTWCFWSLTMPKATSTYTLLPSLCVARVSIAFPTERVRPAAMAW